jgi:hypothetical protein
MELKERLNKKHSNVDLGEHGLCSPLSAIIDYVLSVYLKDGEQAEELSLSKRKEFAIDKYDIKKQDIDLLTNNKSEFISNIITDVMKDKLDRQWEMYISALEASTILLEVVRRPVDDELKDDKWLSALRAKKEGLKDSRELLKIAADIAEDMTGIKDSDMEEHVDTTVFKSGVAEKFARMATEARKKK